MFWLVWLASGLNTAAQQIGGGLGIAVVSTVLISFSTGPDPVAGFRAALITCAVFAAVGLFTAIALLDRRTSATLEPVMPHR